MKVDSVRKLDEGEDDESMDLDGEADDLGRRSVGRGGRYKTMPEAEWRRRENE